MTRSKFKTIVMEEWQMEHLTPIDFLRSYVPSWDPRLRVWPEVESHPLRQTLKIDFWVEGDEHLVTMFLIKNSQCISD
jgi:hypothetical protein